MPPGKQNCPRPLHHAQEAEYPERCGHPSSGKSLAQHCGGRALAAGAIQKHGATLDGLGGEAWGLCQRAWMSGPYTPSSEASSSLPCSDADSPASTSWPFCMTTARSLCCSTLR